MADKGKGGRKARNLGPPRGISGMETPAAKTGTSLGRKAPKPQSSKSQKPVTYQGIPDAVSNRMARRVAVATGIPTVMGMGVFIGSYLLVSRQIADIPPGTTLVASGACFLLGLLGLSFGVLSASWGDQPGSLLGAEQVGLNIGRLRESFRNNRKGGAG